MASSSGSETSEMTHSSEIEQKLNQILEQQKSKTSISSATPSKTVGSNLITDEDVDKLKAEIYNLRQQLNSIEKNEKYNIADNMQTSSAGLPSDDLSNATDSNNNFEVAKVHEAMVVKVKELESRLAEYEIIADDIAELSQLRTDNAKLKEQLLNSQQVSAEKKPIEEVSELIAEAPAVKVSEESSADLSGQAMVDALFAEANAAVPQPESSVPESDQNLLNEFEKISQKKGNE